MKVLLLLPLILLLFIFVPQLSYEHQDGCHRWHSCPSDSGSYICGDKGYDNYCPSKQSPPDKIIEQTNKNNFVTTPFFESLKYQIKNNIDIDELICPNKSHVLTERPNGKIVCVFEKTAEKLNWEIFKVDKIEKIPEKKRTYSECMADMSKGCSAHKGNVNGYAICMSQVGQSCSR